MMKLLDRMTPGDMPAFEIAMALASAGLSKLPDAAIKHMIVISDGDPSPPTTATMQTFKYMGAKVSTVAIGIHGTGVTLKNMADFTGGKFYSVTNATLPHLGHQAGRVRSRPAMKTRPACSRGSGSSTRSCRGSTRCLPSRALC